MPKKLQVHLVTDRFQLGGGLEHIFQIVNGMGEIDFCVFGKPGPGVDKFKNLPNVRIHDNGFGIKDLTANEPGIIHFHHLKPLTWYLSNPFTHQRKIIPIIYTVHGLHIHKYEFMDGVLAPVKYTLRFELEKRLLKRIQKVIAVSREDKEFMETRYGVRDVEYITNGIDFSRIISSEEESKTSIRTRLKLPEEKFIFVTPARLNFQKGHDILLHGIGEIIKIIKKEKHNCLFLFLGAGENEEELKALNNRLGLGEYVQFLGEKQGIYDWIRAGDICLLPSRWEGLPIVLLEAGLLKVPVMASDTYGNREIIRNENGILFKNPDYRALGEAILNVLRDRKNNVPKYKWNIYTENLFNEIKNHYNPDYMINSLRKIYMEF